MTLALCLALAAGGARAAEDKKKEKKAPAPKPVEAGRVYTQSDLERVIQESKAAPPTPLPPAHPPAKPAVVATRAPAKASTPDAPLSFSNDDLERMYGKVEPTPPPEGAAPAEGSVPPLADPLAEVADWQAQRAAAGLRRDQAKARVKEMETQLRDLEGRAVAVRNPYLPRPAAPPGLEEGWDTLPANERAARIDARVAELRAQLARARQEAAKAEVEARAASAPPSAE